MLKLAPLGRLERKAVPNTPARLHWEPLGDGVHSFADHFVVVHAGRVQHVVNKTCQHNGGRLIQHGNTARCPLHGWEVNLQTLRYANGLAHQPVVQYTEPEPGWVEVPHETAHLELHPRIETQPGLKPVRIEFLSHATLYIQFEGFSLITDPWLLGPAFLTGWWLSTTPPPDALDKLNTADVVYISHNHPDHLHVETLQYLRKDAHILTANFQSKSSETMLRRIGFEHVFALDFLELYGIPDTGVAFSVLKSGDFRDDSGLYLNLGGFQALFTVDANFLNGLVLPNSIDLLATSFASGASGFPLCFEDYTETEKASVIQRNRNAIKSKIVDTVKATNTRYYLPYAGYFHEFAPRDVYIATNNQKNSPEEVNRFVEARTNAEPINPLETSVLRFKEGKLITEPDLQTPRKANVITPQHTEVYTRAYATNFALNDTLVEDYFRQANFSDHLFLYLQPTDDDFRPSTNGYLIDFSSTPIQIQVLLSSALESHYTQQSTQHKLFIAARSGPLACLLQNKLPWEDLSIGFQCRIKRTPNVYNSRFWYYFTNEYIGKDHFRYSAYCGACNRLDQSPYLVHNATTS